MEKRLVAFLYQMMNEHVPVSTIDKIMSELEKYEDESDFGEYILPDRNLAEIAEAKAILILHG